MDSQELELYDKIRKFQLDDPEAVYKLSTKLAWEHNWSAIYTLRAIHEYKKFVFLAVIADQMVSPSKTVDLVWHGHLLYTYSYWHDFCGKVLGYPLHHYPSGGGNRASIEDRQRYQATLELYRSHFGNPPADIWEQINHPDYQKLYRSILNPLYSRE